MVVVGANGYIGSRLVPLLMQNTEVIALDRNFTNLPASCDQIQYDLEGKNEDINSFLSGEYLYLAGGTL